jgi:NADH:ubiquinone oxidoreductase subunit E
MNDLPLVPALGPDPPAEPGDFFGAEDARAAESIDPAVWEIVDRLLDERPGGPERLIPVLLAVQRRLGSVPHPVQEYVAGKLRLTPVQVYGVVRFYSGLCTDPPARHRIRVCVCPHCALDGGLAILEAVSRACAVGAGGRSADGRFEVGPVRGLEVCGLGPVVLVGDTLHRGLTPETARALVERLRESQSDDAPETRR